MAIDYKKENKELRRMYKEVSEERDTLLEEQEIYIRRLHPVVTLINEYLNEDQVKELEIKIEELEKNNYNGV